jgi:hypothetical protein
MLFYKMNVQQKHKSTSIIISMHSGAPKLSLYEIEQLIRTDISTLSPNWRPCKKSAHFARGRTPFVVNIWFLPLLTLLLLHILHRTGVQYQNRFMPSHSNNDASEAWTDIDSHSPVPQRYFTDEISPPQNTRFYISDDDNIEAIDYKRHACPKKKEKIKLLPSFLRQPKR